MKRKPKSHFNLYSDDHFKWHEEAAVLSGTDPTAQCAYQMTCRLWVVPSWVGTCGSADGGIEAAGAPAAESSGVLSEAGKTAAPRQEQERRKACVSMLSMPSQAPVRSLLG